MKKLMFLLLFALTSCTAVPNTTSIVTDSQAGYLSFEVKPTDAKIYIDGEFVGLAKYFNGKKRRLNILPGEHVIELKSPGYEDISRRVYVSDTQEHFNYDMSKADGRDGNFVVRT